MSDDVLTKAPEGQRRIIRRLLVRPRAWRKVCELVDDECDRIGRDRPQGFMDVIRYIFENWETWYPILVAILAMFGIIIPPIPIP
jgi:hypothetical protein